MAVAPRMDEIEMQLQEAYAAISNFISSNPNLADRFEGMRPEEVSKEVAAQVPPGVSDMQVRKAIPEYTQMYDLQNRLQRVRWTAVPRQVRKGFRLVAYGPDPNKPMPKEPEIACPVCAAHGGKKKLNTLDDLERHMQAYHEAEWRAELRNRERKRDDVLLGLANIAAESRGGAELERLLAQVKELEAKLAVLSAPACATADRPASAGGPEQTERFVPGRGVPGAKGSPEARERMARARAARLSAQADRTKGMPAQAEGAG